MRSSTGRRRISVAYKSHTARPMNDAPEAQRKAAALCGVIRQKFFVRRALRTGAGHVSLLRCPGVGPHPPKWRATLPSWAGWPEHVLRLDAVVIIRGGGSGGEPGTLQRAEQTALSRHCGCGLCGSGSFSRHESVRSRHFPGYPSSARVATIGVTSTPGLAQPGCHHVLYDYRCRIVRKEATFHGNRTQRSRSLRR
jgi:hypothetical protein